MDEKVKLVIDGQIGKYNRRRVTVGKQPCLLPDRIFRGLLVLAVAAKDARTEEEAWVSYDQIGSRQDARDVARLVRNWLHLTVKHEECRPHRRRLSLGPEEIQINVELLRSDRDHRIRGLFNSDQSESPVQ